MLRELLKAAAVSLLAATAADSVLHDEPPKPEILPLNGEGIASEPMGPRMQAYCLIKNLPLPGGQIEQAKDAYKITVLKIHATVRGVDIGREVLLLPAYEESGAIAVLLTVREYRTANNLNQLTVVVKNDGSLLKVMRGPRINPLMTNPNAKLARLVDAVGSCGLSNMDVSAVKVQLATLSYK